MLTRQNMNSEADSKKRLPSPWNARRIAIGCLAIAALLICNIAAITWAVANIRWDWNRVLDCDEISTALTRTISGSVMYRDGFPAVNAEVVLFSSRKYRLPESEREGDATCYIPFIDEIRLSTDAKGYFSSPEYRQIPPDEELNIFVRTEGCTTEQPVDLTPVDDLYQIWLNITLDCSGS
jgi:hypothetical protein